MSSVKKRSSRRKPANQDAFDDNTPEGRRESQEEGQMESANGRGHKRNESLGDFLLFNDFGLADLSTPDVSLLPNLNSPTQKSQSKAPPSSKNSKQILDSSQRSRRSRRSLFLAENTKQGDDSLDVPPPPLGDPPADDPSHGETPEGAQSKGGASNNTEGGCKRCTCKRSRCLKLYCD
eukprot:CAMPEP_0118944082 /NCGR_PEP_ID=MMETSP1169-20130426/39620_1 /TAXON_ID=36882 /ORGANISM="Pyramimonas obovata, Strain CCMP722" /LENGTH=177 /DNA_ID=CAMNT_0006889495 /DNA_START=436 /DNA_END=966 /DNA_ORIENTATION=-